MAGSLLQSARNLCRSVLNGTAGPDGGFAYDLTFKAKTGETASIQGLVALTHYSYEEGVNVNTQNGRATVYEADLADAGYPVRNASRELILKDDFLTFTDANGDVRSFVIDQTQPSDSFGAITLILGRATRVTNA